MSLLIQLFPLLFSRHITCSAGLFIPGRHGTNSSQQLVVIKTEKEAKEENWVTGMSGEKKKLLEYHKRRKKKKNQDCPKFCYRRDMQEVSSKEGKDYIPVLIL